MRDIGGVLALGVLVLLLVILLPGVMDPGKQELRAVETTLAIEHAPARAAAVTTLIWAWVVIGGLVGAGLGIAVVKIVFLRARLIYPRESLYPAVAMSGRSVPPAPAGIVMLNEPQSQIASAAMRTITRINAGTMRALLRPESEDALLPPPPALPETVSPAQVVSADPELAPHWLLVGETGSGKSSASYMILDALRRQHRTEYVICERDGINWNAQASAITIDGYAHALDAVEDERQRRADLLRQADVDHIARLPDPPPYLVLVIEEAESVYGALALHDRALSNRYRAIVRDIAGLGRKQGILLLVCTQTGTSEVFDIPTRKNLSNKLFFRAEPAVGDAWGIPRTLGLNRLPTGTAYSLRHGATVTFPQVARPVLPLSSVYQRTAVYQPITTPASGSDQTLPGIPAAVPQQNEWPWLAPDMTPEVLTAAQRRRIWHAWIESGRQPGGPSLRGVERILWPTIEHGGTKFYLVRHVIRAELAARHTTLPEEQ